MACAVLHNICKMFNVPIQEVLPYDNREDEDVHNMQREHIQDGLRYRDLICNTYF